jgi:hypothetical protein
VLYNELTAITPSQCCKGKIMNQMTKDIMAWLKVDVDTAIKVQEVMMEYAAVSFGNSSKAVLKRLAQACLTVVNAVKAAKEQA